VFETSSGFVADSIRPGATGFFSVDLCCSSTFGVGDIASYSMSISFRSEVTTLIGDITRDGSVDLMISSFSRITLVRVFQL
jgi:hypothetical protein